VKRWKEAESMLQDCFENNDWNMFKDSSTQDSAINMKESTSSVKGFIKKYVDDVVPTITIQTYPNQKPLRNGDIHTMLRAHAAAFNISRTNPDDSDECDTYKASRYDLHKSIRDAIRQYRLKLELMYDNSDLHCMLQGLQTIIDYKGKSICVSSCQTIPNHPGRISLL
jgi:hypothetical protein